MGSDVDLNTISLTATLVKPPDFAQPWTFLELRAAQPRHGVLFISAHVRTDTYLRLLEELSIGDKLLVIGQLAYSRSSQLPGRSGQHCIKSVEIRRLSAHGRVLEATPELPATPAAVVGDRRRRQRKRRARPERRP